MLWADVGVQFWTECSLSTQTALQSLILSNKKEVFISQPKRMLWVLI